MQGLVVCVATFVDKDVNYLVKMAIRDYFVKSLPGLTCYEGLLIYGLLDHSW